MVADSKSVQQIQNKYIKEKNDNEALKTEIIKLKLWKENQTVQLDKFKNKVIFKDDEIK